MCPVPGVLVEIENQLVRLREALIAERCEVRDVAIVVFTQVIEDVAAATIDRRQRRSAMHRLEQPQPRRTGRRESLVDEHLDRIGMVDGKEPELVEIGSLP